MKLVVSARGPAGDAILNVGIGGAQLELLLTVPMKTDTDAGSTFAGRHREDGNNVGPAALVVER